jgi:hypothetical protein
MTNIVAKRNYGVSTEMSKSLNELLGDKSGRTVSRRTTQGFKKAFDIKNMDDENTEDIVHAAMISTGLLLASKNDNAKIFGVLLLAGLIACYQIGK